MELSDKIAWLQLLLGLLATLAVGQIVSDCLTNLEKQIKDRYPEAKLPEAPGFEDIWQTHIVARTPGGEILGRFEQVIFFGSLISGHWPIAASWLAFKLASKWKTWTTTWQSMRLRTRETGAHKSALAHAHLARTGLDHRLFLVGTAGNIVAGFAGFATAALLAKL